MTHRDIQKKRRQTYPTDQETKKERTGKKKYCITKLEQI